MKVAWLVVEDYSVEAPPDALYPSKPKPPFKGNVPVRSRWHGGEDLHFISTASQRPNLLLSVSPHSVSVGRIGSNYEDFHGLL